MLDVPTRVRFSGIALSYNLCITILSGFAPLAALAMIERTGMLATPAVYIATCTLLTLISTFGVARATDRPAIACEPVVAQDVEANRRGGACRRFAREPTQ